MWLVRDGQAVCNVVLPRDAKPVVKEAAADLVRIVRRSTGATLRRLKAGSARDDGTGLRLRVDPALARRHRGLPPAEVFRITCKGQTVEVSGARGRAVAYGVYQLLEEVVDVRWFWPGALGEDIPKKKNLRVKAGDRTYKPALSWRSVGHSDREGWFVHHKMDDYPVSGGHAYHELAPQELFEEHPEFFAQIYGKRRQHPSQICHTAPGLVDRAMAYIEEQLARKPEATAVSFCPSDYGFFCECDDCRAIDDVTKYYDYFVKEPPYGYGGPGFAAHLSERVFDFTNRVAERLAEQHPDKYLICFAYGAYRFPPAGMTIRDNVIVWLTHTCVGMFNPERRAAEIDMFRQWRKVAKHIVIFEALANQCWPCLPRAVAPLVEDQLKLLKRHGIEGYYTQMWGDFSQNLPSYYVAARLSWEPARDGSAELRELYRRGFGPAARHIAAYYQVFEDVWRAKTADGSLPWARSVINTKRQYGLCSLIFTKQVMADARAAIEKAKKAAGSGLYARRVRFVEAGLRYTELMVAAVKECVAIEDMNIPLLYPAPWLTPDYPYEYMAILLLGQCERRVVAHACRRALAAFDEVERFVRKYDGQYVLGPEIVRRSSSQKTREILGNILRLAEAEKPDKVLERKMFVTREI